MRWHPLLVCIGALVGRAAAVDCTDPMQVGVCEGAGQTCVEGTTFRDWACKCAEGTYGYAAQDVVRDCYTRIDETFDECRGCIPTIDLDASDDRMWAGANIVISDLSRAECRMECVRRRTCNWFQWFLMDRTVDPYADTSGKTVCLQNAKTCCGLGDVGRYVLKSLPGQGLHSGSKVDCDFAERCPSAGSGVEQVCYDPQPSTDYRDDWVCQCRQMGTYGGAARRVLQPGDCEAALVQTTPPPPPGAVPLDECQECPNGMVTTEGYDMNQASEVFVAPITHEECKEECLLRSDCGRVVWTASVRRERHRAACRVGEQCCRVLKEGGVTTKEPGSFLSVKEPAFACAPTGTGGTVCEETDPNQECIDMSSALGDWSCLCMTTGANTALRPAAVDECPATAAPDTLVPPTPIPATPAPPTPAPAPPPTQVPPTPIPPTPSPLTGSPPTSVPATLVPSTPVPRTGAPRTSAPATRAPATPFPRTAAPPTSPPAAASQAPTTMVPATPTPAVATNATDAPDPLPPYVAKAEAIHKVTGTAAAASGFAGANAGSGMRAAMVSQPCQPDAKPVERYTLFVSPLGMRVLDSYAAGAVVGNMIVSLGVYVAGSIVWLLVGHLKTSAACMSDFLSEVDAQGFTKFPSLPLLVFQVLYQGTTYASMELVIRAPSPETFAIGAGGTAMCIAVPLWVWKNAREGVPVHAYVMPYDRGGLPQWLLWVCGQHDWVSRRRGNHWVERWGSAVRPYRMGLHWYNLVEYAGSFAVSALASTNPDNLTGCGHVRAASACVFVVLLLTEVHMRPHLRRRNNVIDIVTQGLLTAAMVASAVGYYTDAALGERRPDFTRTGFVVGSGVLQVVTVVLIVRVVIDIVNLVFLFATGKRRELQRRAWELGDPNDGKESDVSLVALDSCAIPSNCNSNSDASVGSKVRAVQFTADGPPTAFPANIVPSFRTASGASAAALSERSQSMRRVVGTPAGDACASPTAGGASGVRSPLQLGTGAGVWQPQSLMYTVLRPTPTTDPLADSLCIGGTLRRGESDGGKAGSPRPVIL